MYPLHEYDYLLLYGLCHLLPVHFTNVMHVGYEKCLVGLNAIVKEAWTTSQQTQDKREKIQALSLAKECYGMKLDLLTNATVVDDAIRFVTEHGKSITTPSPEVGTTSTAFKPLSKRLKTQSTHISHPVPQQIKFFEILCWL